VQVLFAAKYGDLHAVKCYYLQGVDLESADYDGRTALHIAASEGYLNIVQFLLSHTANAVAAKDRWGRTPLDDAVFFNHADCAAVLEPALASYVNNGVPLTPMIPMESKKK